MGAMGDQRLEIEAISKQYGDVVALKEMTFDVRAGSDSSGATGLERRPPCESR
jgi:ABC-type sugar transport system ATPase subunit